MFDDISEIFKFELCNIPSSLFNTNEFPRESKKSLFSDVLWLMQFMKTNTNYVLDDGSLLHRILGREVKNVPTFSKHASLTCTNTTHLQLSYLMDIQSAR